MLSVGILYNLGLGGGFGGGFGTGDGYMDYKLSGSDKNHKGSGKPPSGGNGKYFLWAIFIITILWIITR